MNQAVCIIVALTLTLAACTYGVAPDAARTGTGLGWLAGCWQTDGGVEETWVRSNQGDQLFGYSVTSKDGRRVFFEQLRIDVNQQRATLYAYPRGVGPTAFEATLDEASVVEFINARNDYPQRIRYAFVDGDLVATIAMLDNSEQNVWRYRRCD